MSERGGRRTLAAVLATCAAVYLLCLGAYYVGFFNDDAFYLIGARSLLSGGFRESSAPGDPPLTAYLPGYPLLLAPLLRLFPNSYLPCQLLSVAALLGTLALSWRLLGESLERERAAAVLLAGLSPLTVGLSGAVLSDPAFALLSSACLLVARTRWSDPDPRSRLGLGLLCALAFYLRPTGLALPAALVLALLLERRRPEALLQAALAAAVVGPWLLRNALSRGHALPYAAELAAPYRADGAPRLLDAARAAAYYLHELFSRSVFRWPWDSAALSWATTAAAAGLCLLGARHLGLGAFGWSYLGVYSAAHLLWDKTSSRYLLPFLPLALASFFAGLRRLDTQGRLQGPVLAVGLLLCAPTLARMARAARLKDSPMAAAPSRTAAWLRENAEPRDVVVAELDGRWHLLSGRKTIRPPRAASGRDLALWLRRSGARYAVSSPSDPLMRGRAPGNVGLEDFLKETALAPVFQDERESARIYDLRAP